MSIHLRKRGEIWYARGTVRVGQDVIVIPQFATGCTKKGEAEDICAHREREVRANHLAGETGRQSDLNLMNAFQAYFDRPGGVKNYDKDRIIEIADRVGTYKLKAAAEAWASFLRMRCVDMAPATVARWRAVFVAAIREGCKSLNAGDPPKIPGVKQQSGERVVYLTEKQRETLLGAYNKAAGRAAFFLAYTGCRTQEALRFDWRYADFEKDTIFIADHGREADARTKTGFGRIVPMHWKLKAVLLAERKRQGNPEFGSVFLNRKNKPFRDTRGIGGNPLAKAHISACKKAAVTDFRVHDWRHDFASRYVMAGNDLETLRRIMGWSSLRMAARYVWLNDTHMAAGIARLA